MRPPASNRGPIGGPSLSSYPALQCEPQHVHWRPRSLHSRPLCCPARRVPSRHKTTPGQRGTPVQRTTAFAPARPQMRPFSSRMVRVHRRCPAPIETRNAGPVVEKSRNPLRINGMKPQPPWLNFEVGEIVPKKKNRRTPPKLFRLSECGKSYQSFEQTQLVHDPQGRGVDGYRRGSRVGNRHVFSSRRTETRGRPPPAEAQHNPAARPPLMSTFDVYRGERLHP